MSLRVPIADPTLCMRTFTPAVIRSCDHAVMQSWPRAVLVCSTTRCRNEQAREVGCASLGSSRCGLPKRQSRVRRRLTAARVGYSPSRDPSAAWPDLSGEHRTASSFHEYFCFVTPIFLTTIGNGLASPHLDFDSRSIGNDLLGQFFLSA